MLTDNALVTGKRRLKRLPVAPHIVSSDHFKPTASDWKRLQTAFGVRLDRSHRSTVLGIVDDYLFVHQLERVAPFAVDAISWLKNLDQILGKAQEKMRRNPNIELHLREAEDYARDNVVFWFRKTSGTKWTWGNLARFVADLKLSCRNALIELEQFDKGFIEGSAWNLLIVRLTDFARANNFPTTAWKGGNTPPFVKFVRQLQNLLPKAYRHHLHSDDALAQAISVARRKPRKTKSALKPK